MEWDGFGAERSRPTSSFHFETQTYGSMPPVKWYDLTRERGP